MRDRSSARTRFSARKFTSKRRRLEELLQREAQFRTIFESAAIGIVLADAEGRPRECNPAFMRMFGLTGDEFRARRISEFTHPDDADEIERALKALVEGELERVYTERRFIRKDGSFFWVHIIASTVINVNGEPELTIATVEDISALRSAEANTATAISGRKSAEVNTAASKQFAADLIEIAGAMIVGLDLNGDIQLFNRAAEEITGYAREELTGRNWFEVVVPRERYPAVWEEFERLVAGGLPQEYENPILTKSGEERYIVWRITDIKEHGLTVGMVSIGIDVTELKRTEEALRHERDLVAKIIDTSPIGIVALDRQGEITFANADAERVLGLTRDEAAGRRYNAPDWRVTDYDGRPFPDEESAFRRVMATGQSLYNVRHAIEIASGERVYLSVNAAPILGENGEPDGMIASIENVSEGRRQSEEKTHLAAQLLQAQKMEAIGLLAGGVAHNFNNLLTAISGYNELLLAKLPEGSDLHADAEEVQRATTKAALIASELLVFSRRERGQRERLDLNAVILEIEMLLQQVIRSNIEIATVLADDLGRVESDRSLIEQALLNLVVNSSDAMPDGGKLTIETANLHLAEPRFTRDLSLPAGNFVTLTVRDSGIGMDEETRARIFEPFFTTKGPDRGTGLGLSTVYGIIEENEGSILVESAPGQGSTFTIFLPSIPDQRSRS